MRGHHSGERRSAACPRFASSALSAARAIRPYVGAPERPEKPEKRGKGSHAERDAAHRLPDPPVPLRGVALVGMALR